MLIIGIFKMFKSVHCLIGFQQGPLKATGTLLPSENNVGLKAMSKINKIRNGAISYSRKLDVRKSKAGAPAKVLLYKDGGAQGSRQPVVLMMLTVFVDPAAVPAEKQRELILKACADVGAKCDFVPQKVERTISWQPPITSQASEREDIQKEVLAVLQADDALDMINSHVQNQNGAVSDQLTLSEWVRSVQSSLSGQNVTVIIVGLDKYFRNQKLVAKQKYREAVTGQAAKGRKRKATESNIRITRLEAEEAFVEVQLSTGCVVQQVSSDEELASQIKHYTKAVAEKPAKKDRLDNVFSFLETGASRLNVSKQGEGLNRVWKHQLMQFKNFGAEMADALQANYPSPSLLYEACQNCSNKDAEKLIGDINVRRNASVISTNRKIGKEQAKRIHTFMVSTDPEQVIK